jgi:hypothetical protein
VDPTGDWASTIKLERGQPGTVVLDGSGEVIYNKAGDASVQDLHAVLGKQDSEPDSGWQLSAPAEAPSDQGFVLQIGGDAVPLSSLWGGTSASW